MKSQEQCIGCVFWKKASLTGGTEGSLHVCHHLLETGKRRIDQDGVCLSRTTIRQHVTKMLFNKPIRPENACKKKVKAVEDGIVFESMTAAEKHYGLARGRVCVVTNDPHRTARGQHFITV